MRAGSWSPRDVAGQVSTVSPRRLVYGASVVFSVEVLQASVVNLCLPVNGKCGFGQDDISSPGSTIFYSFFLFGSAVEPDVCLLRVHTDYSSHWQKDEPQYRKVQVVTLGILADLG